MSDFLHHEVQGVRDAAGLGGQPRARRRTLPGLKAEPAVGSSVLGVVPAGRRDRLGVAKAIEDLEGEALVTEAFVEALRKAVLPGATGFDVERRDNDAIESGSKLVGDEFGPGVS